MLLKLSILWYEHFVMRCQTGIPSYSLENIKIPVREHHTVHTYSDAAYVYAHTHFFLQNPQYALDVPERQY